jgi:hypothetical protein
MSLQQYATLTPDLSSVQSIDTWNSAIVSALQAAGNPKFSFLRIVNMTAQPSFDPTTQVVVQNGWTVTTNDVEPVWQVIPLTPDQQQAAQNATQWNNVVGLNLVQAFTNAINNWGSLTPPQKDTVLLNLVKFVRVLLPKFGVNN